MKLHIYFSTPHAAHFLAFCFPRLSFFSFIFLVIYRLVICFYQAPDFFNDYVSSFSSQVRVREGEYFYIFLFLQQILLAL